MTQQELDDAVVTIAKEGPIVWLSLNRPSKHNAMNPALNRRMHAPLDAAEEDYTVEVVALRGVGGNFSVGLDMKEFRIEAEQRGPVVTRRIRKEAERWWDRLRWLDRTTIALVEGWCIGGACGPLAARDFAVASQDVRFVLPEVDFGFVPLGNITKVVSDLLPPQHARYHLVTGLPFDGRMAADYGLVLEALPGSIGS